MKKRSNSFYIGKFGKAPKRYVYYDKTTKKRIYGSLKQFKSPREFKVYISQKGYLIGSQQYQDRIGDVRTQNGISTVQTKKPSFSGNYSGFCVRCDYKHYGKTYYSRSSVLSKKARKNDIEDAKNQAIENICAQILKTSYKTTSDGITTLIENQDNSKFNRDFEELYLEISRDGVFYYEYSRNLRNN